MNEVEFTKEIASPRWAKDLLRFLPVKSQFILSGNIRDYYPFPRGESAPSETTDGGSANYLPLPLPTRAALSTCGAPKSKFLSVLLVQGFWTPPMTTLLLCLVMPSVLALTGCQTQGASTYIKHPLSETISAISCFCNDASGQKTPGFAREPRSQQTPVRTNEVPGVSYTVTLFGGSGLATPLLTTTILARAIDPAQSEVKVRCESVLMGCCTPPFGPPRRQRGLEREKLQAILDILHSDRFRGDDE
jgi:hypothetical protein